MPALDSASSTDISERYSTDVQSIISNTIREQSGTWVVGQTGNLSQFLDAPTIKEEKSTATLRATAMAQSTAAMAGGVKLGDYQSQSSNKDDALHGWLDFQKQIDAELTKSHHTYLSGATTAAVLEGELSSVTSKSKRSADPSCLSSSVHSSCKSQRHS